MLGDSSIICHPKKWAARLASREMQRKLNSRRIYFRSISTRAFNYVNESMIFFPMPDSFVACLSLSFYFLFLFRFPASLSISAFVHSHRRQTIHRRTAIHLPFWIIVRLIDWKASVWWMQFLLDLKSYRSHVRLRRDFIVCGVRKNKNTKKHTIHKDT